MPTISCPYCRIKLKVEADDIGHKVECTGCQTHFVADDGTVPPAPTADDPEDDDGDDPDARYRRSRRRNSRDRDFEERYGARAQTGMGTTSMVLGIVSLPMILMFAPVSLVTAILSIIFGCIALKTEGRRQGITGIICSVIALVLLVLFVIGYVIFIYYIVSTVGTAPGGRMTYSTTVGTGPGKF
jgi:hypothetical protein